MTEEEIDNVVCEILVQDGPDGHCDGHEVITAFIKALLNDDGPEWVKKYLSNKSPYFACFQVEEVK